MNKQTAPLTPATTLVMVLNPDASASAAAMREEGEKANWTVRLCPKRLAVCSAPRHQATVTTLRRGLGSLRAATECDATGITICPLQLGHFVWRPASLSSTWNPFRHSGQLNRIMVFLRSDAE